MRITYADLLIVSSDPHKLSALQSALRALPLYHATFVDQFAKAQTLMRLRSFDLVLLDVDQISAEMPSLPQLSSVQHPIPLLVVGHADDLPAISTAIENGAAGFILTTNNPHLLNASLRPYIQNRLLVEQTSAAVSAYNEMEHLADDLRNIILPLGIEISAEKDVDRLLSRILAKAMAICHADGGLLHLCTDDNCLRVVAARIRSRGLAMGADMTQAVTLPDLPLYNELGEPADDTPASWVALEGETINIENAFSDSGFELGRMTQFDELLDYRTISCLSVPLRNGNIIGVMTLINAQENDSDTTVSFTPYHELVVESLASQATVVIHNRRLQEREADLLYYKRELNLGRRIQTGFLPEKLPMIAGWTLASRFDAAREVAGDFYDLFELPNGKLGFIVADVCDKGVVAALFMALLRTMLRAFLRQHYLLTAEHTFTSSASGDSDYRPFNVGDESALLNAVRLSNEYMVQNHSNTYMFATVIMGGLDPQTGEICYINAGHTPALINRGDHVDRLMPTGPAVGLQADARYRLEHAVLEEGDTLLAYTDGVTEARNLDSQLFGEERLVALLEACTNLTPEAMLDVIETAVYSHTNSDELADDLTMLVIKHSAESDPDL